MSRIPLENPKHTASRNLRVNEAAVCADERCCVGPRGTGSPFSSPFPLPALMEKLCDTSGSSENILSSFISFPCIFFSSPKNLADLSQGYPQDPNTTQDLATEELLRPPEPVTYPPLPSVLSHDFQAPSLNRVPGKPAPGHALAWLPTAPGMLNNEKNLDDWGEETQALRSPVLSPPHPSRKQGGRERASPHAPNGKQSWANSWLLINACGFFPGR